MKLFNERQKRLPFKKVIKEDLSIKNYLFVLDYLLGLVFYYFFDY